MTAHSWEASINANPSDKHLIERLFEVERIEDAVSRIRFPLAFTDQLYDLRSHIGRIGRMASCGPISTVVGFQA